MALAFSVSAVIGIRMLPWSTQIIAPCGFPETGFVISNTSRNSIAAVGLSAPCQQPINPLLSSGLGAAPAASNRGLRGNWKRNKSKRNKLVVFIRRTSVGIGAEDFFDGHF